MKVGTEFPVTLEGHVVARATVESVEDGKATLIIPATRFVMGIKSSLVDIEPEVEQVLLGTQDKPEKPEPLDSSAVDA